MSPSSDSRGAETTGAQGLGTPKALLTTVFCAFAALLPIVCVVAPKGTVVLLLLAAVLAVPAHWWAYRRFPVPDLRFSIALVLLVVWCAIASAWSDDPARSLVLAIRIAVLFAAGMALFPVVAALERSRQNIAFAYGSSLVLLSAWSSWLSRWDWAIRPFMLSRN